MPGKPWEISWSGIGGGWGGGKGYMYSWQELQTSNLSLQYQNNVQQQTEDENKES